MTFILPGHEDLRERPVFDAKGQPLMVTTGNGILYPLVMGPTGHLKAGVYEGVRHVNSGDSGPHSAG
jgi:hypothetical protein